MPNPETTGGVRVKFNIGRLPQSDDDRLRPEMRPWRSHMGYALLRLRVEVTGASQVPVKRPGDLVLAVWTNGTHFAKGWMLKNIGFGCVLNEPEVEVIERP